MVTVVQGVQGDAVLLPGPGVSQFPSFSFAACGMFEFLKLKKRLYEKISSYFIVERPFSLPAAIAGSMRPFCFKSDQYTDNTNRRQIVPVTTHTNTHRPALSLCGVVIEQRSWRFFDD